MISRLNFAALLVVAKMILNQMTTREYFGGYDELVELNQALIEETLDDKKFEIKKDIEKDIHEMLNKAFKGNKHVKIK